ncbi:MAG: glycoside hydrolase family 3 protein [Leptospiraceae bacterium]|nr:glycoside hydrolase family 3 protein [Leptospiraceae bacterium]
MQSIGMNKMDSGESGDNPPLAWYMNKKIRLIIFLAIAAVSFLGTVLYPRYLEAKYISALDGEAQRIISSMTRTELLGQLIHISVPGKDASAKTVTRELATIRPGGVILFGYNIGNGQELQGFNETLQKTADALKIPDLLISTDQEGGRVIRVTDGVTQFPSALAIGQADDAQLSEMTGFQISRELRSLGINLFFAPVLDVNNNPQNPVIGIRSLGSNVEMVTRNGVAFERGARHGGAIPVIKHFPGHGNTNVDSHYGLPVIPSSLEDLRKLELVPFQAAINNGAKMVMSAHIMFPALDKEYPGTLSKSVLTNLLREQMGFQGVTITDAMEMKAIADHFQKQRPAVLALLAGIDIILTTSWGEFPAKVLKELQEADAKGEFLIGERDLVKEAVYRQIRLKLEFGLLSSEWTQNADLIERETEEYNFREKAARQLKEKYPDLNKTISLAAIRSLQPVDEFKLEQNCKAEVFSSILKSKIKSSGKNKTCLLVEAGSAGALRSVNARALQNPTQKFYVLFWGNPFEYKPNAPNLQIIYSFSPTAASRMALAETLEPAQYEKLRTVDLILPQMNSNHQKQKVLPSEEDIRQFRDRMP